MTDYVAEARAAFKRSGWGPHLEESFMIGYLKGLLLEKDDEIARWKAVANEDIIRGEIAAGQHDDQPKE